MTDLNQSKNILEKIKKSIKKIEWFIDIYFVWILYSPRKYDRYNEYIGKKWGKDDE